VKQPKLGLYRVKNRFSTLLNRTHYEEEILLLIRCFHHPIIGFQVEFLSERGIVDGRPFGTQAFWWFLEVVEV
jgi:hypothetical protein